MNDIVSKLTSYEFIIYLASFGLIVIGLYIVFTSKNILKIIIGLD